MTALRKGAVFVFSLVMAFAFARPAFTASTDFNKTTTGTFDSNDNANWNNGRPTNNGLDVNFTQNISVNQTVTNLISAGGGSINYLRLAPTGTGLLSVYTPGIDSQYGLQLNARATLFVTGNSTFSHGNNSFDNLGGTLVISNSATAYINIGANTVNNNGTIEITAAAGQTSGLNYGQSGQFLNNSNIVVNGAGTSTFVGVFGGNNNAFRNAGTITVNSGTLVIDPRDGFSLGGFNNSGTVTVNSGANFVISRTANAWGTGPNPTNDGRIFLNGGTMTALVDANSGQATTNFIVNNATIIGSGTLAMSVKQSSTGSTIASNGVLAIFGTYNGGQATFTSSGGGFGVFKAVSGGELVITGNVASGMGGSWNVDSGGTLTVASGFGVDLGSAFMPGSQLNGTVKVLSGANLTLASAAAGGPTLQQNGTFLFTPGTGAGNQSKILMPNTTGLAAFTNAGWFVLASGSGSTTFQTGFGSGQNNYGIVNVGTIVAGGGATLILNSSDAVSVGGFSNTSLGTIIISNNSNLAIDRTATGWAGGSARNAGQIFLNSGTLLMMASGAADGTRIFQNSGTISTWANSTNRLRMALNNLGRLAVTGTASEVQISTSAAIVNGGTIDVWNSSRLVFTNLASSTSLNYSNAGTIRLQNGTVLVSNLFNTGTIVGDGTITAPTGFGVVNAGMVLASNLTQNAATLTVQLSSFTNAANATLGVLGTSTVLNVWTPNNNSALINLGTISLSGGSITNTLVSGFSITNFNIIAGVGNLSGMPVVNQAGSSIIAQSPVQGISNLVASVANTNAAILGANNVGGAATLNLSVTSGGLVNNGTIALQGGFLVVSNATGITTVTNNTGLIFGNTNQTFAVANLSGGRIMASNGVFTVGLQDNQNAGVLSNFNSTSTLNTTNTTLINTSTGIMALNSGTMGAATGGSITNQGLISGPGTITSSLYNDTTGTVLATNGTETVGTDTGAFVGNIGTFSIANGSTLNVVPAWNNLTGGRVLIGNAGGAGNLTGGNITNSGTILGNGTISSTIMNLSAGTIKATNGILSLTAPNQTMVQQGTLVGGTAGGTYIAITNNTGGTFVNSGTMVLDGSGNLAFYILNNATNATTGVIRGAGVLQTADGASGGANFGVFNAGLIQATNGALVVNSGDAFRNPFINVAGATVDVASASTFGFARTANAWTSSPTNPVNNGVILMNGGSIQTYDVSGTGPGAAFSASSTRTISNAVGGLISGSGTIGNNLVNLGTVNATNGTLVLAGTAAFVNSGTISIQNNATFTSLQSSGTLQNNGGILMFGGTLVATNMNRLQVGSSGSISGFGTISTGRETGSLGANAPIVNSGGSIIATNGTLYLNPGDAFALGGLSNSASGVIIVANGAALVLNRTYNAWGGTPNTGTLTSPRNMGTIFLQGGTFALYSEGVASNSALYENYGTITGQGTFSGTLTNFGTVVATNGILTLNMTNTFWQAGTLNVLAAGTLNITNAQGSSALSFTNGGAINMRGGTLTAGEIGNTNVIFGWGTIAGGGVDNGGAVYASNAVLTLSLSSFTNKSTAILGTLSTNATLNIANPVSATQPLINLGTVSMAGGTMLFNGTATGTISNQTTGFITGVGTITQTVVNNGTIMAANPVSGLSVFSVGLSDLNSATIGASNNATLNVVISGGAQTTFSNAGSIAMRGGSLTIQSGAPGTITNLSGAFVSGVGTIVPNIVNLANGTVQATNGILDVSLSTTNAGFLRAYSGATLTIENPSFVNTGTIAALGTAGGTIQMANAAGIITNRNLIIGNNGLAINGYVQNDSVGTITATNGVLAFNSINGLNNQGTIEIQNSGTFQSNSSNSWANAGTIDLRGGTLRTGGTNDALVSAIFTNIGNINGYGTMVGGGAYGLAPGSGVDKSIANLGTILVTNPLSSAGVTMTISTGGATSGGGIQNLGTMIVSSNNTLVLNRNPGLPILNTGTITINNGTLTGSGVISNTTGGIIEGYGTLTHEIVNLVGGTIRATNGNMVMTSGVNPINFGTFQITAGATMTWNASNSWINSGTIDMRGGTLRTGGITNAAPPAGPFPGEPFTNANYIVGYGTIYGGGAYGGNGSGYDKAILNIGTITASGGTLILDTGVATAFEGLANRGTMVVATTNDTLVLSRTAEFGVGFTNLNYIYNSGTILINGGTLTSRTSITNKNEGVGLPGLIQGFGHIALTNELVNLGTIRSTNNVVGGNGEMHFVDPSGSTQLKITQGGTLVVEGGSQMIFGSTTNAALNNAGTIIMRGGILRSGTLTNQLNATFRGFGTITSPIVNLGTGMANSASAALVLTGPSVFNQSSGVLGATNGRLEVQAVFTNAGTVSFFHSVGTFNSSVVNQGAWIMDPSTNVFNSDYTVTSSGYIQMSPGDVMVFSNGASFINSSTMSNIYNTLNGKFVFEGGGGLTQGYYVAGIDTLGSNLPPIGALSQINAFGTGTWGSAVLGYSNNFALGTFEVGSLSLTSTVILIDSFGTVGPDDGRTAGLYVDTFNINAGSLLIISNNVEFYFHSSNGVTGVSIGSLTPGDNVLILSGGSFHQIVVIPEPSILMLLMIGGGAIQWYRRRHAAR